MMTVMTNGGGQDGMWTDERGRAEVDGRIAACCRNGYVPPTGISTTPRRRPPGRPRRAYSETAAKQERKKEREKDSHRSSRDRDRSTGARTRDTCFRCYVRAGVRAGGRARTGIMYRCCLLAAGLILSHGISSPSIWRRIILSICVSHLSVI